MGYSSALRYACAVAAIAGLTGCNPPARRSETSELRVQAVALESRVQQLEAQLSELEAQVDTVRTVALSNADSTDGLRETVNGNARIANANALREMTARGDCGTEVVPIYANDGSGRQVGLQNKVIPCTLADLKP